MKLRTTLFWTHLAVGVTTLLFVFIMSATGVMLAFQRQIVEWSDTHAFRESPPSIDAVRLRPDQIVTAVRQERPGAVVSSITVHADPAAPAAVVIGRQTVFLNPYSGRLWGEGSSVTRAFFRVVSGLHTGLGGNRDGVGHTILAAANLAVVFMLVTGLILWMPRRWTAAAVRHALWFKGGLSGRARDFNWHHAVGFWCAVPLLVIVVGALPMSYAWASDLVFRAVGESPEPRRAVVLAAQTGGEPRAVTAGGRGQRGGSGRGGRGGRGGASASDAPPVDFGRVSDLWARVEGQESGWRTITARMPAAANAPLEFTIDRGTSQQPQKRSVLSIDMNTGDTVGLVTFGDRSYGARVRTYLRFAHTGEVLGLPSQLVAAVSAAAACVMAWTGLALSWRRFVGVGVGAPE